jgi:hypothetical protein
MPTFNPSLLNSPLPIKVINTENVRVTPIQEVLQNGYQSLVQTPRHGVTPIPTRGVMHNLEEISL